MLHLLQQNRPNVSSQVAVLIGISSLIHVLLLILMFLSAGGSDTTLYKITLDLEQISLADVVLTPLAESSRVVPKQQPVDSQKKPSARTVQPQKTCATAPKTTLAAQKPVSQKKISAPVVKKPTPVKKAAVPAKKPAPIKKPVVAKKIEPPKKMVPQKVAEQPKGPAVAEKKSLAEQKTVDSQEKSVHEKAQLASSESAQSIAHQVPLEPAVTEKRVVSYKQLEELELRAFLQEELQSYWRPPAGLASDLSCGVVIVVDQSGKAATCEVIAPSGVLIYDIHVQSALMEIDYPRHVWGKKVEIDFACA